MDSLQVVKPFQPNKETAKQSYLLSRTVFRAVIDRYSTIDTLSTWTLGATGLAAGLAIKDLSLMLKPGGLHWILGCFILSAFAGLIQKILAIYLEYVAKVDDQVNAQFQLALDSLIVRSGFEIKNLDPKVPIELQLSDATCKNIYSDIRKILDDVVTELRTGLPWPFKTLTVLAMKTSETDDILYGLKRAGKFFLSQLLLLNVQLLLLIFALIFALIFVDASAPRLQH